MIDIVALAEEYTKGKRGDARKASYEAFIAGAQALSVATRAWWTAGVDHVDPKKIDSSYDTERRRAYHREYMRKHRAKKNMPEELGAGHQWFTAS